MTFAKKDSWGKDPAKMTEKEAEAELRHAAHLPNISTEARKAIIERAKWIYQVYPNLRKINVFDSEAKRHDSSSHVDLAKLRDDLEKQIISAASPQKQRELRMKLSRVEDKLQGSKQDADPLKKRNQLIGLIQHAKITGDRVKEEKLRKELEDFHNGPEWVKIAARKDSSIDSALSVCDSVHERINLRPGVGKMDADEEAEYEVTLTLDNGRVIKEKATGSWSAEAEAKVRNKHGNPKARAQVRDISRKDSSINFSALGSTLKKFFSEEADEPEHRGDSFELVRSKEKHAQVWSEKGQWWSEPDEGGSKQGPFNSAKEATDKAKAKGFKVYQ